MQISLTASKLTFSIIPYIQFINDSNVKNYRDKHNDSLITDLDDVSIVCENEDINAEKDVKVKLALLTIVFTHFC